MGGRRASRHRVSQLVSTGADLIGGATGVAIEFLLGGVPGAFLGAAGVPLVRETLLRVGDDLQQRFLGPREAARVGAAMALAVAEVQHRLTKGDKLRNDGFFEATERRADADEVVEAVLLAVQRDPQEAKVKHYAALLSYIAFTPTVDRNHASLLISLGDQLSYRQLQLLAGARTELMRRGVRVATQNYEGVFAELTRLYDRRLMHVAGMPAAGNREHSMLLLELMPLGHELYDAMALDRIKWVDDIEVPDPA